MSIIHDGVIVAGSFPSDYVVEQGVSGIWTYRKWNSGLYECWLKKSIPTVFTAAWGSMYSSDTKFTTIQYPITFVEQPCEFVSIDDDRTHSCSGWVSKESIPNDPLKYCGSYSVIRPTKVTDTRNIIWFMKVIGRWEI